MTLVCLSATVANADQLAAWISEVRGATGVVIETHRPVELKNMFVLGDRSADELALLATFVDGKPNPEAVKLDGMLARPGRGRRPERPAGGASPGSGRPRIYRPRRSEVVERLAGDGLLPAIYFVFSRAGCDESVRHCLEDGLRLDNRRGTRPYPRHRRVLPGPAQRRGPVGPRLRGIWPASKPGWRLITPGWCRPFREAVEACFSEALVKVVFATETLALGINMPARRLSSRSSPNSAAGAIKRSPLASTPSSRGVPGGGG